MAMSEYTQVRRATIAATDRCLIEAATWLSELGDALLDAEQYGGELDEPTRPKENIKTRNAVTTGRLYFQRREYQRCAQKLKGINDPIARFLRLYALHMDCEAKTKVELSTDLFVTTSIHRARDPTQLPDTRPPPVAQNQTNPLFPPLDPPFTSNGHQLLDASAEDEVDNALQGGGKRAMVAKEMLSDFSSFGEAESYDSYLHYMRAILDYHYLKNSERAKAQLVSALQKDGYNWAAWVFLAQLMPLNESSNSPLQSIHSPLLRQCFRILHGLESKDYLDEKYLNAIQSLLQKVPTFGAAQLYKSTLR